MDRARRIGVLCHALFAAAPTTSRSYYYMSLNVENRNTPSPRFDRLFHSLSQRKCPFSIKPKLPSTHHPHTTLSFSHFSRQYRNFPYTSSPRNDLTGARPLCSFSLSPNIWVSKQNQIYEAPFSKKKKEKKKKEGSPTSLNLSLYLPLDLFDSIGFEFGARSDGGFQPRSRNRCHSCVRPRLHLQCLPPRQLPAPR